MEMDSRDLKDINLIDELNSKINMVTILKSQTLMIIFACLPLFK